MTTVQLVYVAGVITGLIIGLAVFYPWGRRNGHLAGYQDHRADVTELRNEADMRRAELEDQDHAPRWPDGWSASRWPASVPGGGRPFPMASPRLVTTADDIGPVFVPGTDTTRIPVKPQPGRDSGTGTAALPRLVRTTGEMRAATDSLIAQIIAGTWPPPRKDGTR